MIYRSNLLCPDLTPQFAPHLDVRVRPWSMGHDVPGDREFEPECTSLTHDEAAILYHIAQRMPGPWIDLGCRFGWSTLHIYCGCGAACVAVDQALIRREYLCRFLENVPSHAAVHFCASSTEECFKLDWGGRFVGGHIDANHDPGEPLKDAQGCLPLMAENAVMVFHDGAGQPIQDAVLWLIEQGWHAAVYATPNVMFVCWRGEGFDPPQHMPDPAINWDAVLTARLCSTLWPLIAEAL